MKKINSQFTLTLFFILSVGMILGSNEVFSQSKKNRARINADFVNDNGDLHYLNIKASSRVDKKTVALSDLNLTILQEINDQKIEIGKTRTNASGISKFIIDDFPNLQPDSTGVYNLVVSFKGNDSFSKASRKVSFRNAEIKVNWFEKDSVNYIQAKILDTHSDSSLTNIPLEVRVDRLFRPLKIGERSYRSNEQGEIEMIVEDSIPGIDGKIKIEVVLNENDDYGTVIGNVIAPIGSVIVDKSTFDQRTMWSPRGKTPIFLLTLTYSFIFIVWGIFLYLFINFVKIFKA